MRIDTEKNIEIHVSHACNLACESCSHFSNQGHKGNLSLAEAEAWLTPWSTRVRPRILSLLGGEPTINRALPEIVTLARRLFPDSLLRLVTNGFLLSRHDPALPEALADAGNTRLYVSRHHDSEAYAERFAPAWALAEKWAEDHDLDVRLLPSTSRWRRTYHGFGAEMRPFVDGNPRQSWENCPARDCHQIFEGRLWKCPPLAYLGMQDAKYGLSEDWAPYLAYEPLSPSCSDAALEAWLGTEDEPYCGMCPAKPELFDLPLPFRGKRSSAAAQVVRVGEPRT